jgi:hypothetical protein
MGPVDDPAFVVPDVFAAKHDFVAGVNRHTLRYVQIVDDQDGQARFDREHEPFVRHTVSVVREDALYPAACLDLDA